MRCVCATARAASRYSSGQCAPIRSCSTNKRPCGSLRILPWCSRSTNRSACAVFLGEESACLAVEVEKPRLWCYETVGGCVPKGGGQDAQLCPIFHSLLKITGGTAGTFIKDKEYGNRLTMYRWTTRFASNIEEFFPLFTRAQEKDCARVGTLGSFDTQVDLYSFP